MFLLLIRCEIKDHVHQAAEECFSTRFRPAVSAQEGFREAMFLRPEDGSTSHVLSIGFENQILQKKWAATDLHDKVWRDMKQHFVSYTVNRFATI